MKFKMNDREWEIKEVEQKELQKLEKDEDERNTYYGLTVYDKQMIYIWNELHPEQKRQTLIHELFHCYVGCYYSFQETVYTEELVCNLVGNSHDIIHEIVEEYFKPTIHIDLSRQDLSKYAVEGKFGKDEGWKELKLQ